VILCFIEIHWGSRTACRVRLTFVSAEARPARRAANARDLVFACASRAPRPPRAPPANCFIYVRARQARSLKKSLFSSSCWRRADTKSRLWQTFFHDLFIVALVAPPVARRVERSFRLGFPRARGEKIRASLSLSLSLCRPRRRRRARRRQR